MKSKKKKKFQDFKHLKKASNKKLMQLYKILIYNQKFQE